MRAVTVARVAERGGVSVGLVQHYFPTKDDMLLRAFHEAGSRIRARVGEHIRAGSAHRRPISAILLDAVCELLPLDEERRAEFRVARTFSARSLDNPALADIDAETAEGVRRDIAQAVHNGKECGEVDPGADPAVTSLRLAAVTEGLAARLYRAPEHSVVPADDTATEILRAEIAAVFTGHCRQYG